MLRHCRWLLIILAAAILTALNCRAQAQVDDDFAPWRLEAPGEVDAEIPEGLSDSAMYSTNTVLRWRQSSPAPPGVSRSPAAAGMRARVQGRQGILFGLTLEKDAGESQYWDNSSACFEAQISDNASRIILGDYLVGYGSGLVIRTARSYGLGNRTAHAWKPSSKGLRAYSGWTEELALRGAAVSASFSAFRLDLWGSQRLLDARLDSNGWVLSFDQTGLHRTDAEIALQETCREDVLGIHIEYPVVGERLRLGGTGYALNWNRTVLAYGDPISTARAGGIQVNYGRSGEIEAAWDANGQAALSGSWNGRLRQWHGQALLYHVAPDYVSPLAAGFDFNPGATRNREGLFASLAWGESHLRLSGFAHLYRYPRRQPGESWGGEDLSIAGEGALRQDVSLAASSRWVQEEEADTAFTSSRWRGNAELKFAASRNWSLQTRLSLTRAGEAPGWGQMIAAEIKRDMPVGRGFSFHFSFATGIYRAQDYALRLYWIEADAAGTRRVHPLWGDGAIGELSVRGSFPPWGELGIVALRDQPHGSLNREAWQAASVVYHIP